MLVAGIVKWISDSEERKTSEIKGKREMFESALRKELEKAAISLSSKLNQEFADTAIAIVTPTLLEAEAASGAKYAPSGSCYESSIGGEDVLEETERYHREIR